MRWLLVLALWLVASLLTQIAFAHAFSVSALSVDLGQARLTTVLDLDVKTLLDVQPFDRDGDGELSQAELSAQEPRIIAYVDGKLSFLQAGKPCRAEPPQAELAAPRRLLIRREYRCERPLGLIQVENRLLMEDVGGHRVVTRFVIGRTPVHAVFIPSAPRFELDASAAPEEPGGLAHGGRPLLAGGDEALTPPRKEAKLSILGWVQEGIHHILIGLDHILFVLALMIGVKSLRQLVKVITAFTVAHSITLALGATGAVNVSSRLVESLIALSIIAIAYDNYRALHPLGGDLTDGPQAKPRSAHRASVAFGFGLIHGFGFASVLSELGLPEEGLLRALLGFNIGVELGQLALVAPMYPFLRWFEQREGRRRAWVLITSAIVGSIGILWLFERMLDVELLPL